MLHAADKLQHQLHRDHSGHLPQEIPATVDLAYYSVILDAALAAAAALACVIFAAWIYRFNEVPLDVPLAYSGDALYYGALIKGVIENGWYLHNPSL